MLRASEAGSGFSGYKLSGYNSCATVGNFTLVSLYRWEDDYAPHGVVMQTRTLQIVLMGIFWLCQKKNGPRILMKSIVR